MIKVRNEVTIYEERGQKSGPNTPPLLVMSHAHFNDRIVLVFRDPREEGLIVDITVAASDLIAAITNAKNTASRW